tara:strand:+ start:305 stop:1042 length:738 start_codon:yes stop_codon:yes gene_type:complete
VTLFDFQQVTVSKVSRHYGRRRALSSVSVGLQPGEVVGLLGPNGSGKSTLLGVLSTLIAPSSGEVRYGEQLSRSLGAELRRLIGFLSHDLQLYPELSARENLEFYAKLYGDRPSLAVVNDALVRARLDERAEEPVSGFSRGMRQRLALERSLIHKPRLVLLDEPFTGLDDRSTTELIERLRELSKEDRLIVVATHDLDIAGDVLDRAVVLRTGRITELPDGHGSLRSRYRELVTVGGSMEQRADV